MNTTLLADRRPATAGPRPSLRHDQAAGPASQEDSIAWLVPALAATGLDGLLSQGQGLSLLAPSDAALQRHLSAAGGSLPALLADVPSLRQLLLAHLLSQALGPTERLQPRPLSVLGGPALWLEPRAAGPVLRDGLGRQARLLRSDLRWGALQVHLIDRVLTPPRQDLLAQLAALPQHSLLCEALDKAGLAPLLRASGPFTLFAPEDQGLARLAARLGLRQRQLMNDAALLSDLLRHHLLPGRWASHELPWGGCATSAFGQPIEFSALGLIGGEQQAQALLSGSDRPASNGLIHRLADALLPQPLH